MDIKNLRTMLSFVLVVFVAADLTACRRHQGESKRGVYAAPKNAKEAAFRWRGRKLDFVDAEGQTQMRLRWRKLNARVFGPKLHSMGFVREVSGSLLVSGRDGAPQYVFKRLDEEGDENGGRGGFMIYSTARSDGEEVGELPAVEAVQGWVLPTDDPGGWVVLDKKKAKVLTVAPESAPQELKIDEADLKWETLEASPDEAGLRLTHLPSGAEAEVSGDGLRARDEALGTLKSKLAARKEVDAARLVTFESPQSGEAASWLVKVDREAGRRRVSAHLRDSEGRISEDASLSLYSKALATLAFAPSLATRFDPLMRAGLIRALARP